MKSKKDKAAAVRKILEILLIVGTVVIGVPIAINEFYKLGGYVTLWEAADVLSYYGSILGAFIAVGTLAVTILFTRKQIQRDSYLKDKKETWLKTDESFTSALKAINPIPPMKESIENGREDASNAIITFQGYQLSCQTALDEVVPYLSEDDYLKVKELIDAMNTVSKQCCEVAEKEVEAYKKLRDFNGRCCAQQTLDMETEKPGSFPDPTLVFCERVLQNTDSLNYEIIFEEIGKINEEVVSVYEKSYRPLLALKRKIFARIDDEVQKEADSILQLWRK